MSGVRRFLVFLLFLLFFGAVCLALFASPIKDMVVNLSTGLGAREYVALGFGADGGEYVVAKEGDGFRLVRADERGKTYDKPIKGIEGAYEPCFVFASESGATVLGVYVKLGMNVSELRLYTAADKENYSLLLSEQLYGVSAPERRSYGRVVSCRVNEKGAACFTVATGGEKVEYTLTAGGGLSKGDALSSGAPAETEPYSVRFTSLDYDGGTSVIDGGRVYRTEQNGAVTDYTAALYRSPVLSGILLGVMALVILVLSYGCCFAICHIQKFYFPLVLKNAVLLALAAIVACGAALGLFALPAHADSAREGTLTALYSLAFEARESDEKALSKATEIAANEPAMADVLFAREPAEGRRAGTYVEKSLGRTFYTAYADNGDGTLTVVRVNAQVFEERIAQGGRNIALFCLAAAGVVLLVALMGFVGVTKGARRVTKGMGILASGGDNVRVVNNSGDEMEALAKAFNDMSSALDMREATATEENDSYLRFVPSRLISLLGVNSIDEIDKSISASHTMAMMVVRFSFPKEVYQSSADTLFQCINEVFERIGGAVTKNDGAIYNFTYDGFDAVFEKGVASAVGAAVSIRQEILDLNKEQEARGDKQVQLRVALDYGPVMMGVVGDRNRVVPTVVSACLDTARDLADLAAAVDANILCTAAVADSAKEYGVRYIGKGREGGALIRVYEIYDGDPYATRIEKESMREPFSTGVFTLYGGNYAEAKRIFMDIARRGSEDGVVRRYLYLADEYEKNPPNEIGL